MGAAKLDAAPSWAGGKSPKNDQALHSLPPSKLAGGRQGPGARALAGTSFSGGELSPTWQAPVWKKTPDPDSETEPYGATKIIFLRPAFARLEKTSIAAGFFPPPLLVFLSFSTTSLFRSFQLKWPRPYHFHPCCPSASWASKCLVELLLAPEARRAKKLDTGKYLAGFFSSPLLKDHATNLVSVLLLLSACYLLRFTHTNLMLRVNPHTADGFLSRIDGRPCSAIQAVHPAPAVDQFPGSPIFFYPSFIFSYVFFFFPGRPWPLYLYLDENGKRFFPAG